MVDRRDRPCRDPLKRDSGRYAITLIAQNFAEIKGQNPMLRIELDGISLLLTISKLPDAKYAKPGPRVGKFKEKYCAGKLAATMDRWAIGRRFQGKGIMSLTAILVCDSRTLAFIDESAGSHILVDSMLPRLRFPSSPTFTAAPSWSSCATRSSTRASTW